MANFGKAPLVLDAYFPPKYAFTAPRPASWALA